MRANALSERCFMNDLGARMDNGQNLFTRKRTKEHDVHE
jgi:hypothetical protein